MAFPQYTRVERERERDEAISLVSLLIKGTNPTKGAPPLSTSNYLPKPPSPNTVTLGVRASVYGLEGDTNVPSITGSYCRVSDTKKINSKVC